MVTRSNDPRHAQNVRVAGRACCAITARTRAASGEVSHIVRPRIPPARITQRRLGGSTDHQLAHGIKVDLDTTSERLFESNSANVVGD